MAEQNCSQPLNEIISNYYDYLKAFAIKNIKDKNEAEDIVQEVMLKLVESCHKLQEIDNIKAWLFRVAKNEIIDQFKKRGLNDSSIDIQNLEEDFDSKAEQDIEADFIIPMIKLLPEAYSKPLILSDIEGIPQKDIASQLELGLSTTKMRIQRGRKKLYELYENCCEIEYDSTGSFLNCHIKDSCKTLKEIESELNKEYGR
ncbi:sigma-70 family RNA polymerase sigma factor [Aureibacter tunicatorum]|uniref:RNA polymerase sigma-70 factor (ECF subfamily) n=1 Tax=Aureibacter tunicatorum TaxID=866807 RepID=A0AAE4BSG3_9BACT|nr:sigma-70 family RNA polymerase sigma factor [Aureibacter tunicatorum]MDR6238825.1 RNA polymerase sigma-70 factor (ECF subfamily) [Aureibacter tunicatorum]BDD05248.1 hypothetical protein AUTU_27310 [Aureibacter tunicatorum]